MTLFDSHTHIYDEAFDSDRDEAVARGCDAGVVRMMMPAIDSQSHERLFDAAGRYPGVCLPMMGLHPTSVNGNPRYREELELVERYLARPPEGIAKFYAVGEVGIDLYWSVDYQKEQTEAFERQIELSVRFDLPLVVHVRSAWKEVVEILQRHRGRGLKGVMHAFSGGYEEYRLVKEAGDFLVGVGGVVTYKNNGLTELLKHIPLDDIVLETDSPYLTPVPHRGKRNESAYLTHICARVAEIYGVSPAQAAEATTRNAALLFGI